ncbi:major facilitator superfamily domain-containing protein [Aspergillus pseudodeflectus]|uniref:Major facilitator superfamily domain-containing protein n=1 Tax=Aspergillus pseudodeflectus TaxID=176178 RepID=A0ABR4JJ76_9EURO
MDADITESKTTQKPRANHDHVELATDLKTRDTHLEGAVAVNADAFPDGGAKAWFTALGGFLAFIASIGFLSGGSVFQSYFKTTLLPDSSLSDIAWIGSVQVWGCFFFGIWSGSLSDKYGPALPLAVGTFFMVFGNMMASLSTKFYQFLLSQGFCVALGMGLVFTPALAVQSQWFLKHRGLVVGFVMSGQMIGGIIWPILANRLLNFDSISYAWTLRIIGFMQLGLMAAAILLVRRRFSHPVENDFLPLRKYFTDPQTMLLTAAIFLMNLGIYVPWFYITPYASHQGATSSLAFYDAAILNAGAFAGCYALGPIADSGLGFFNSVIIAIFSCAVVAFAWIGCHSDAGVIVWAIAYGIVSGALQAIFSPCISMMAPTPEVIGSWNGICITISSFAVLASAPVAGQLIDNVGGTDYLAMQLFTAVSLAVACAFFIAARFWFSRSPFV